MHVLVWIDYFSYETRGGSETCPGKNYEAKGKFWLSSCFILTNFFQVTYKKDLKVLNYATAVRYLDLATYSSSGNRTGNNGQIQLWQFLLELLTTQEYKSIIQWIGNILLRSRKYH